MHRSVSFRQMLQPRCRFHQPHPNIILFGVPINPATAHLSLTQLPSEHHISSTTLLPRGWLERQSIATEWRRPRKIVPSGYSPTGSSFRDSGQVYFKEVVCERPHSNRCVCRRLTAITCRWLICTRERMTRCWLRRVGELISLLSFTFTFTFIVLCAV
jgi:hypothetical protein